MKRIFILFAVAVGLTGQILPTVPSNVFRFSAGANVFAAQHVAKELGPGKNVVTVLCDTGERYLSVEKYFNI